MFPPREKKQGMGCTAVILRRARYWGHHVLHRRDHFEGGRAVESTSRLVAGSLWEAMVTKALVVINFGGKNVKVK